MCFERDADETTTGLPPDACAEYLLADRTNVVDNEQIGVLGVLPWPRGSKPSTTPVSLSTIFKHIFISVAGYAVTENTRRAYRRKT